MRSRILPVAAALLLCACGGDGPTKPRGVDPGWLDVKLTQTPNTDDGIIAFSVSGPRIDSVRRAGPGLAASASGSSSVRFIAHGTLSRGVVLARIWVPDRRQAYVGSVGEAAANAAGGYVHRASLAQYVVNAERPRRASGTP